MALFKILRGSSENFTTDLTQSNVYPAFHDGYCYFIVDTGLFYVDYENNGNKYRIPLNAGDAKTILGATLEHDILRDSEVEIPSSALLYAVKNAIEESVSSLEARKANKITGLPNQFVGFDDEGNFIAKDSVKPDWSVNDENSVSYVKNRTHYEEETTKDVVLENKVFPASNNNDGSIGAWYYTDGEDCAFDFESGVTYRVIVDNKEYDLVGLNTNYNGTYVGNFHLVGSSDGNNGPNLPFDQNTGEEICLWVISPYETLYLYVANETTPTEHTVSIYKNYKEGAVHQLDPKYIPTPTDDEILELLIETDAISTVVDENGKFIVDNDGLIISW